MDVCRGVHEVKAVAPNMMEEDGSRHSAESSQESRKGLLTDSITYGESSCRCDNKLRSRALLGGLILSWSVSLALLVLLLAQRHWSPSQCAQPWDKTEFEPATKEITATTKRVRFNAALKFNESHYSYIPPTSPRFTGPPDEELEASWRFILGPENIFVTPKEHAGVEGNLYHDPEYELYLGELTVFHDLHCLNYLRQYIYLDHYPTLKNSGTPNHLDHCIDAVRLSLMCKADMTLIPLRWSENRGSPSPDFETTHTCRDFGALREWAMGRNAYDADLRQKNAERLLAAGV